MERGLLTIPIEIRKMIFESLFADSYIAIRAVHDPAPIYGYDGDHFMRKLDLTNFPYAITMTSHQIRSETIVIMDRPTELRIIGGRAVRNLDKFFLKFSFPLFGRPIHSLLILYNDDDITAPIDGTFTLLPDLTAINVCADLLYFDPRPEEVFQALDMEEVHDPWAWDRSDKDARQFGRKRSLADIEDIAEAWTYWHYRDVDDERGGATGLSQPQVKVVLKIPFRSDTFNQTVRDTLQRNVLETLLTIPCSTLSSPTTAFK